MQEHAIPDKVLVYGMTDNPGGIEKYLTTLIQNCPKGRFDFVCDFPQIAYRDLLEEYGCSVFFIPAKGKALKEHLSAMYRLLKAHPEYKTVYFNILDAGAAVTALVPWLLRRKIVVHSHNGSTDKVRLHRLTKPLLNLEASGFVACSCLAANHMFTKANAKKALIVPNMVDVRAFRYNTVQREETRASLGLLPEETVVLHIGRISLQKNPLLLADIAAELKKKSGSYKILSVGDGEMRDALLSHIRETGTEDTVLQLGIRNDIPALYSAADIFILPSFYEGLPIVGVEAQASGLPCILSSRITPEIKLTDCVSFLSPDAGAKAWADVIEQHKNDGRRSTANALAEENYDIAAAPKVFGALQKLFV
ncbi:MAG: glycosyltransferase [Clostridia bacterium]|nr:glycosyltransferase [Clostridia bacterium]